MSRARCPRCESPEPRLHPAMQFEGEVQPCEHEFHRSDADGQRTWGRVLADRAAHPVTGRYVGWFVRPLTAPVAPEPTIKERAMPTPAVDQDRLYATTRADVWAEEFAKVCPEVDRGLMLGWFANAIETGRSAGRSEAAPVAPVENEPEETT
jgi:hypothetical protein